MSTEPPRPLSPPPPRLGPIPASMSPKVSQRPGAGLGRRGVRTYPDSGRGRGLAVLIATPPPRVCLCTCPQHTLPEPGCRLGLWPAHFAPRSAPSLPPVPGHFLKEKKEKKKLGRGLGRCPKILLGPTRCLFLYIYIYVLFCLFFVFWCVAFLPSHHHSWPQPCSPCRREQLGVGGGWVLGSVSPLSPVGSVVAPAGCIAF